MIKRKTFPITALASTFILAPLAVRADGIVPITTVLMPDMILPYLVLMGVIILLEGAIIRWRIKELTFRRALGYSAIANLVSSIAGSAIYWFRSVTGSFDFMFMDASSVLFIFLLTLLTEIPTLKYLCRRITFEWGRAIRVGLLMNVASYALLCGGQIALVFGLITYQRASILRETTEQSRHSAVLAGETGRIFSITNSTPHDKLMVYDVVRRTWSEVITNLNAATDGSMPESVLDVRGDRAVLGSGKIIALNTPALETCSPLPVAAAARFSPDGETIAVLVEEGHIESAERKTSGPRALAPRYRLSFHDAATGAPRGHGADGISSTSIAWSPDGNQAYVAGLDDPVLYQEKVPDDVFRRYLKIPRRTYPYFVWEVDRRTGAKRKLTRGRACDIDRSGNMIILRPDHSFSYRTADGRERELKVDRLFDEATMDDRIRLSPDGRVVLVQTTRFPDLSLPVCRSLVFTIDDPGTWFLVSDNVGFRSSPIWTK